MCKCIFQAYVSNRVVRIHELTEPDQWNHVPSADNPADVISRGISAQALQDHKVWWTGPAWLSQESSMWPVCLKLPDDLPEVRTVKFILATVHTQSPWLLEKYSSFLQLIRITVLVQRFIHNCKISASHSHNRKVD